MTHEHSHLNQEIPNEILPKLKKYWVNPEIYEFNTSISEINENWIRLKNNYFYPEGGGQPSDHGTIISTNKETSKVYEIEERDGDIWLSLDSHNLEEGQEVEANIDGKRREKLSTNHSAQHLFSAVLWEELEYETVRAEIGLLETQLDVDKKTSFEDLHLVTRKINELIDNELPIFSRYYSDPKQIDSKLRGSLDTKDVYRIVAIDGYDLNLCGGTHIQNTGEIGSIFINKLEGKKIRFYTGFEANLNYYEYGVDLIQLSRLLNAPFKELVPKTQEIVDEKNLMQKKIHKLENSLIQLHIENQQFEQMNEIEVKFVEVPNFHKPTILNSIGELSESQIVIAYDPNGTYLLIGGNNNQVQKITSALKEKGIRGGGKGSVFMGKLNEVQITELKGIFQSVL